MTMVVRTAVARCVKTAVASATRSVSAPLARRSLAAVSQVQQQNQHVRMCSSSRFLSLADEDDGEKKRRRRGEDGSDGDDEDGEEDLEAAGEGTDGAEAAEKDGDLELEELEMYKFCVTETEELDTEIMELYMSNPLKWTPERLARKFHLSKQRIEATIFFEAEDAGLTVEEMKSKIEDAKTLAAQDKQDESAKLKSAEARGDEKEIKRLQKRERQDQRDTDEIDDEELTREEKAMVLGIDDDHFRNPDFFFLSDHFDGLPPLVRRLGKHKATDKLYPEEALEIQRLAAKNKIVEHKSFAKPSDKAMRWKIAVKDTSKIKMPLLVRDGDRALRLATKEEVLPRTWVRRPAFFAGLNPSDN